MTELEKLGEFFHDCRNFETLSWHRHFNFATFHSVVKLPRDKVSGKHLAYGNANNILLICGII